MSEQSKKRYALRKPGGGHKKYRILERHGKKFKSLDHPQLATINSQLLSRDITSAKAEKLVENLLGNLRGKDHGMEIPDYNRQILQKYHQERFQNKFNKDPDAAYNRLRRAIEALDKVSLLTASPREIIAKVVASSDPKRVAQTLNGMLKFIGRDLVIPTPKPKPTTVNYIALEDFKAGLGKLTREERIVCAVGFATGCRIGEVFALNQQSIRGGNTLWVESQLKRDLTLDTTKTGNQRMVPYLTVFEPELKELLAWDSEQRAKLRNRKWSEVTKKIRGNLSYHDLRHSYGIYALGKGVSIAFVAQALGNSVTVCEKHYLGFALSEMGIRAVEKALNG